MSAPPPLPEVRLPKPDHLPTVIRNAKCFIVFVVRLDQKKSGEWKVNKEPVDRATGRNIGMDDRSNWSDINAALAAAKALRKKHGPYYGVGIVHHADNDFWTIDVDDDVKNGVPGKRGSFLESRYPTPIEYSLSCRGLHGFYAGKGPFEGRIVISDWRGGKVEIFGNTINNERRNADKEKAIANAKSEVEKAKKEGDAKKIASAGLKLHKAEMSTEADYGKCCFIALTGDMIENCGKELLDGSELWAELKQAKENEERGRGGSNHTTNGDANHNGHFPSDDEIIKRMFAAKNGPDVRKLYEGRGDSKRISEDDLALVGSLRFWCDNDRGVVDRLFRQSKRMRPKWDEVHNKGGQTYGEMTLDLAFDKNSGEIYDWPNHIDVKIKDSSKKKTESEKPGDPSDLIIRTLSTLKVKPVRYFVPGRIPFGKLILVAGRGGDGKSTLIRKIVADASAGRATLGMTYDPPSPCKVLMLAAEDGADDTILPHLLAEGACVERIGILDGVRCEEGKRDFTLSLVHVHMLRERLKQSPDIKIVVIDPIATYVGRTKVDDHKSAELRQVLDPLNELADSTGVTIIMIAHVNKSTGAAAVDRIAGSAAYKDAVRCAYLVAPDPDDDTRRLLMPIKENLPGFNRTAVPYRLSEVPQIDAELILMAPQFDALSADDKAIVRQQLRRVVFEEACTVDANAVMGKDKKDKDAGNKIKRCTEWLLVFLRDYAFPSKEIEAAAMKAGFTVDNVFRAKASLKDSHNVRSSNKGEFRGVWWTGIGHSVDWIQRPEPESGTTPESPEFQSLQSLQTLSNSRNSSVSGKSGESVKSGDSGKSGVLVGEWVDEIEGRAER